MDMANAQFDEFKKINKSTIVLSPLPQASKTLEKLEKNDSKLIEVILTLNCYLYFLVSFGQIISFSSFPSPTEDFLILSSSFSRCNIF